jgi:hypothetical protein
MSQNIVLAALMPETGTANKPVISVLVPCDRPTHGFQSHKGCLRHVIGRFTFVQLLCSLLTDLRQKKLTFCLLAQAVQYQPLEREAPQGGLETLPAKRIREANHQYDIVYPMYVLPVDSAESFW